MLRLACFISLLLAVGSCAALPGDGPLAVDITAQDVEDLPAPDYLLVKIDKEVVNVAGQYRPAELSNYFEVASAAPTLLIDEGDQLLVNIWEAGADGLFSSAASKATQIQATVDARGRIFVPYVGPIPVAGRSVESVRRAIETALLDRAIQPQVQLLVAESLANTATVVGDVAAPGRYPLTVDGIRVIDLMALAGGSESPTYETRITLKRGDITASANFEDLFDTPRENVPVRPGDTLLVSHSPATFTVFGATMTQQEFPFESRRVTLAEALARAGGLNDRTADARGVFIFRFESAEIAKQLNERAQTVPPGTLVPTIYRLNLRDPEAFFLTQLFEMRNEDLIYVANHPTAEFGKFLQIISPLLNVVSRVESVGTTFGN